METVPLSRWDRELAKIPLEQLKEVVSALEALNTWGFFRGTFLAQGFGSIYVLGRAALERRLSQRGTE